MNKKKKMEKNFEQINFLLTCSCDFVLFCLVFIVLLFKNMICSVILIVHYEA